MHSRKSTIVIDSFGGEWERFDQSVREVREELERSFNSYFSIFRWDDLPPNASGFDMGCGSGRWAQFVSPRVGTLLCTDPSSAIEVAKRNLSKFTNIRFSKSSIEEFESSDRFDFGYCLGVLHHLEDTYAGFRKCSSLLKPGAPFLAYVYYRFDNRPWWFRSIWRLMDLLRLITCRLPHQLKCLTCDMIAALLYWPLSRMSRLIEKFGRDTSSMPLSAYRNRSFYTLRTDALDRFGTPLERRFTRQEIVAMMEKAGFRDISFSDHEPYWCVIGFKE